MKTLPLANVPDEVFMVDDVDYPRFKRYRWYKNRYGYPIRYLRSRTERTKFRVLYVHRLVMNTSRQKYKGYVVDHIDRNPLNNTRENLRIVTQRENLRNRRKIRRETRTSEFKGVYVDKFIKGLKKYKAQISVEGRTTHLGRYENEEDAARAYDRAALENWGTVCHINFSADDYAGLLVTTDGVAA